MKRVHILRGKLVKALRDNVLYCMSSLGLYYGDLLRIGGRFHHIMTLQFSLSQQHNAHYTSETSRLISQKLFTSFRILKANSEMKR